MQRPEQLVQQAIVRFIQLQYREAVLFHIPNGSNVGASVGGIYKSMGLKAGAPDLCILWKPGKCGFIEVKSATGTLTTHQKSFARRCDDLGIPWACVRSIEEAQVVLKEWGVK